MNRFIDWFSEPNFLDSMVIGV